VVKQPASADLLLVDDEEALGRLMESFLIRAGYKVDRFRSGQPALEILSQDSSTWNAAILDLNLPDMSGHDLAQHLLQKDPGIKILLVSGLPQSAGGAGNLSGARIAYLQKPFRPAQMLELLDQLLSD